MRINTKIGYRFAAAALTVTILSCTLAGTVCAGPPAVTTDEALYVNLDHYGKQQDMSVVKGVSLNGLRSFSDYGVYTDVVNMSNEARPQIDGDRIIWNLPAESRERFYYECQLNSGEIVLPWDFDVSYKLNGTPKEAKDLVHANGLVEIDVHCIPNRDAREYYRNNMLLQAATMVDMEHASSVEAPGSQTQSLGNYKVVVFAVVPGEEKTFHIEISTDDFESMGIIMMMIPGTLDQMKEIAEIKEMKDTLYQSTDELLDGMNEVLDTLDRISSGMDTAGAGLKDLQKARASFDASKDQITANADLSLDGLEAVNGKISLLAPHINTSKQTLDEINGRVNAIVKTLSGSGDDFFDLSVTLGGLKHDLEDLNRDFNNRDKQAARESLKQVKKQLETLRQQLGQLKSQGVSDLSEEDEDAQQEAFDTLTSAMEDILGNLEEIPSFDSEDVETLQDQIEELKSMTVNGLGGDSSHLLVLASTIISQLEQLVTALDSALGGLDIDGAIDSGQDVASQLSSIMASAETLIGNVNDLNRTVNDNKEAFDQMLDDTSASVEQITSGTSQLVTLFRSIQNTAKANRTTVENGTRQTLDGLIDILEQSSASGSTGKLQTANESIRSSVKSELDRISDDTNLLNLDTGKSMISFTSDKNSSPASIQVILRTEEISEEDLNTNSVDIEPQPQDIGLWNRIVNVFKNIWHAITSLF